MAQSGGGGSSGGRQRVLVTGASGLLGRSVLRHLSAAGHETLGQCHSRQRPGLAACDLTSAPDTQRLFAEWRPTLVVHCAAERRPDAVAQRPEAAHELNVGATRRLSELAAGAGARLLYVSTDYVFDGRSPPYDESAAASPLNDYGRSKAAGEAEVLRHPAHAVLRVPVLYGSVEHVAESAVTQILDVVRSGRPATVDDWARRFPTHCDDVAMAIGDLATRPDAAGVFHFSGDECFTKFGMALVIGDQLGLDVGHLTPQPEPDAGAVARPRDSQLSCRRLEQLGVSHRRQFAPAIRDCLAGFL